MSCKNRCKFIQFISISINSNDNCRNLSVFCLKFSDISILILIEDLGGGVIANNAKLLKIAKDA